mgnify:CR=1 FL=1
MSSPRYYNHQHKEAVDVSVIHASFSTTNMIHIEFESTLAKMNSRKSSIGPNNPTSWMDHHVSQPLEQENRRLIRGGNDAQSNTFRGMATSASRAQKTVPSHFTSGSLKVPMPGGPTSNLRNLAGHLLMSGSSSMTHGATINDALMKKNSDLQAQVRDQLMVHQKLQN